MDKLKQLITALRSMGIDPNWAELAEWLWLAQYVGPRESSRREAEDEVKEEPTSLPTPTDPVLPSKPSSTLSPGLSGQGLHLHTSMAGGASGGVSSLPFRSPAASALP